MIRIESLETYGWEAAVRGMRNPMNSWDRSDSKQDGKGYILGDNDLTLAKKLVKAGSDHAKFLRMIGVSMDITAPLYWWKEFDTYKVGTTANSCSTMHKLTAKKFVFEDFSHEYLFDSESEQALATIIGCLNTLRQLYLDTDDTTYWKQINQLLPHSYNQKRTVILNYEVIRRQYHARKNHKLDEWRNLCEIYETLPYARDLIID